MSSGGPTGAQPAEARGTYVFVLEVAEDDVTSVYGSIVPTAMAQAVGVGPDGRMYVAGSVQVEEAPSPLYDIFAAVLPE